MPLAIRQIDVVEPRRIITTRSAICIFIPKQGSGTNLDRQFFISILSIVDGEQKCGILVVWADGGEDGEILREAIRENLRRGDAELSFFI